MKSTIPMSKVKTICSDRLGETSIMTDGSHGTIIEYHGVANVSVELDNPKAIVHHREYKDFIKGSIKNPYKPIIFGVGCIGQGIPARTKGIISKVYTTWHAMMARCYSDITHKMHPTYIGCTVDPIWHNFQNFALWYETNFYQIPGEKMCLDKDILVKGNRVYGPNTCCFVPIPVNTIFVLSTKNRGHYPVGVSYIKARGKYLAQTAVINKGKETIGVFDTPEEAFKAYVSRKYALRDILLDRYAKYLPKHLYKALENYTLNEYD